MNGEKRHRVGADGFTESDARKMLGKVSEYFNKRPDVKFMDAIDQTTVYHADDCAVILSSFIEYGNIKLASSISGHNEKELAKEINALYQRLKLSIYT